jgi:hypothetical protein
MMISYRGDPGSMRGDILRDIWLTKRDTRGDLSPNFFCFHSLITFLPLLDTHISLYHSALEVHDNTNQAVYRASSWGFVYLTRHKARYVGWNVFPFYLSCVLRTHISEGFIARHVSLRIISYLLQAECRT